MSDDHNHGSRTAGDLPLVRDNDVFHLLSHHRKRAIVLAVAMAPQSHVQLRQLAELLCALEHDCQVHALDTDQITTVRSNLKRSHLPPLVDAGIINRDGGDGELLTPGPGFSLAMNVLCAGGVSLATQPPEH